MKRILENIHIAKVDFSTLERQRIKDTWREKIDIPFKSNVYCDHVTLAYQPDEKQSAYASHLAGLEVDFHVTGWAADINGQVMTGKIEIGDDWACRQTPWPTEKGRLLDNLIDVWSDPMFHVTVSTADGFPPKYSNQLIADSEEAGTLWGGNLLHDPQRPGPYTVSMGLGNEYTPVIATFTGTVGITWKSRTE